MKRCERCKVNVEGSGENCPLCGGYMEPLSEDESDIFPKIPTIYHQYSLFFRILIWLSVITVTIAFAVNFAIGSGKAWSLIVAAGVGSLWVSLLIAVRRRSNLSKSILYQLLAASVLVVLWDFFTGWHQWSTDYVIPILCVSGMGAMAILGRVMKQYINDQSLYLAVYGVLGFIPLIFLVFSWSNVILPSLICVVISVISLSGVLLFRGKKLKQELKRRMHV